MTKMARATKASKKVPNTGASMKITSKEFTDAGDLALSVFVRYEGIEFTMPLLVQKHNLHSFDEQALKKTVLQEGRERYEKHMAADRALSWLDDNMGTELDLEK